jgi:hypothetical protein
VRPALGLEAHNSLSYPSDSVGDYGTFRPNGALPGDFTRADECPEGLVVVLLGWFDDGDVHLSPPAM